MSNLARKPKFLFHILHFVAISKTGELGQMAAEGLTYQKAFRLIHYQTTSFKFEEIGRKLSKQVENIVGKGEIARYEQFLLFPQCFQNACFPGASKGVIVLEWVNSLPNNLTKLEAFADDKIKVVKMIFFVSDRVENIVEKGENAGYQYFLLFPQCFQRAFYPVSSKVGILC